MSIFLGAANLMLRSVAAQGDAASMRPMLAGILVDPERGITAASDGKRLVEITLPKVAGKFPAGSFALANGGTRPFLLSSKSAQELSRLLGKSKTPGDPVQYAALAAVKAGERGTASKPGFVVTDGKKAQLVGCEAIDASFPDYASGGVFPKDKPAATIVMPASQLRDTLAVCAFEDAVTIHLFKDRVILLSEKADGTASRAVVMALAKTAAPYTSGIALKKAGPAAAAKPEAPAKPAVKAEPSPAPEDDIAPPDADEPQGGEADMDDGGDEKQGVEPKRETRPQQARFRRGGRPSHWRYRQPRGEGQETPSANGASVPQRAFYTYLLRSRSGVEITVEHWRETGLAPKIDELKAQSSKDESFARYPQWRKLCLTLAEQKADDETVCKALNSVRNPDHASSLIQEWLAKAAPAAVA